MAMEFHSSQQQRWHDNRVRRGEVVRGGYFVFRRGQTTGRIKINPASLPFEHGTRDKAMAEAQRLADENPEIEFGVFKQVATVRRQPAKVEAQS